LLKTVVAPFLLVTDLDNTLVGDGASLAVLNRVLHHSRQLGGSKIVYATGRSHWLYEQLCQSHPLLNPDALIASVGTEIYLRVADRVLDDSWSHQLTAHWDRSLIVEIASQFGELRLQPASEQRPFKVSYCLSADADPALVSDLQRLLERQEIHVKLIYSSGKDLDILPGNADKGLAVQHLQQRLFADLAPTVVCGDSENDISLFAIEGVRGIVVGNAQPGLCRWCRENVSDHVYFARGSYGAGILEGLHYFGLLNTRHPESR
jgi:hypothetical protein